MTGDERTQHWFVDHMLADVERTAAVLDEADPTTSVPACPGWDLAALTRHLGRVHRWSRFCVLHPDRRPTDEEAAVMAAVDTDRPGDWLREGARELASSLVELDPAAPTWHPFPRVALLAGIWPRRMAQETAMHRWDAQQAIGVPDTLDADLAADGIDEYFALVVPRRIVRDAMVPPTGRIAVRCDDTGDAWVVHTEGDAVVVAQGEGGADAELVGPAAELLLLLWGRARVDDVDVEITGSRSTAQAWLAVDGM